MTINREPSAIISGVGVLATSVLKLLVLLNIIVIDAQQLAAATLVIDNAIIVLGAIFIRSQVTPVASPALTKGTEVKELDPVTGQPTGSTTTI